jgi:hypothetical protein
MKRTSVFVVTSLFVLFCTLWVSPARADQENQATKVTFNGPVEVPGVVLPAGTYWFTLMSDDADRNIVQVWDASRQRLLTTALTVPDYRMHPTGQPVIKFEERASSRPEALRAWFYPGDNFGHEFVYSESHARDLARRTGHPVLSMRDEDASNMAKPAKSAKEPSIVALKHAQVQATNPSGQEVDKSQAMQAMPQDTNQTMPQR